ncbi:MAG: FAD-dependent thymidylate synthase, partial [Phycisphaerales bacterium]|nr:FAD-dependent thymidylate synthase [Phycisphaerales bacterium]
LLGAPDPRHQRPGFVPYERAAMPEPIPEIRIDVLDHGFVRLVEEWGGGDTRLPEAGIIEAARQSTQGSFRGWRRDAQLLRYLHEHKHATPFEFAGMVLEVRAPIFVFREWHRHRTQSYNEMSARYAPLPDLDYLPTIDRIVEGSARNAVLNKQAGRADGAPSIDVAGATAFLRRRAARYEEFEAEYRAALADGVPKELARIGMPVGRYSQMRASAVLRNWLAFLTLRLDPAAQWEIRQYASAVHSIITERFPQTAALFKAP